MTESKITKDTLIGEIAHKYPGAVQVLFEYGFHCIGCPASQRESVEEGAKAHGVDDKGVTELVEKLNNAAQEDVKKTENKNEEQVPSTCCGQ